MSKETVLSKRKPPAGFEQHPWYTSDAGDWGHRLAALISAPPLSSVVIERRTITREKSANHEINRRVTQAAQNKQREPEATDYCAEDLLPSWAELRACPAANLVNTVLTKVRAWLQDPAHRLHMLPDTLLGVGMACDWDTDTVQHITALILDLLDESQLATVWHACRERCKTEHTAPLLFSVTLHLFTRSTDESSIELASEWLQHNYQRLSAADGGILLNAISCNTSLSVWRTHNLLNLVRLWQHSRGQVEIEDHDAFTIVENALQQLSTKLKHWHWLAIWKGCIDEQQQDLALSIQLATALLKQDIFKIHPNTVESIARWTDTLTSHPEISEEKLQGLIRCLCIKGQWRDPWSVLARAMVTAEISACSSHSEVFWATLPRAVFLEAFESALAAMSCIEDKLKLLDWCNGRLETVSASKSPIKALVEAVLPDLRQLHITFSQRHFSDALRYCFDNLWNDLWNNDQFPTAEWIQYLAGMGNFWIWEQWPPLLKSERFAPQKLAALDFHQIVTTDAFADWLGSALSTAKHYKMQLLPWLRGALLTVSQIELLTERLDPAVALKLRDLLSNSPEPSTPENLPSAMQAASAAVAISECGVTVEAERLDALEQAVAAWRNKPTRASLDLLLLLLQFQAECLFRSSRSIALISSMVQELTEDEHELLSGIVRNGSDKFGTPLMAALGCGLVNWRIPNLNTVLEVAEWADKALASSQHCFALTRLVEELMLASAYEWLAWREPWAPVASQLLPFQPGITRVHQLRPAWISAAPADFLAQLAEQRLLDTAHVHAPLAKLELVEALGVWHIVNPDLIRQEIMHLLATEDLEAASCQIAGWNHQACVELWIEGLAALDNIDRASPVLAVLANGPQVWQWKSVWRHGITGSNSDSYLALLSKLMPLFFPLATELGNQFIQFGCALLLQPTKIWKQLLPILASVCQQRPDLISMFEAAADTIGRTAKAQQRLSQIQPRILHDDGSLEYASFFRLVAAIETAADPTSPLQHYATHAEAVSQQIASLCEKTAADGTTSGFMSDLHTLDVFTHGQLAARDEPFRIAAALFAVESQMRQLRQLLLQMRLEPLNASAIVMAMHDISTILHGLIDDVRHSNIYLLQNSRSVKAQVQQLAKEHLSPTITLYAKLISQEWLPILRAPSAHLAPIDDAYNEPLVSAYLLSIDMLHKLDLLFGDSCHTTVAINSLWRQADAKMGDRDERDQINDLIGELLEICPSVLITAILARNTRFAPILKTVAASKVILHLCCEEKFTDIISNRQLETLLSAQDWACTKYFIAIQSLLITMQNNVFKIYSKKSFLSPAEITAAFTLFNASTESFKHRINGIIPDVHEGYYDNLTLFWERSALRLLRVLAASAAYSNEEQQRQALKQSCQSIQRLLQHRVDLCNTPSFRMVLDFIEQPQSFTPAEFVQRWCMAPDSASHNGPELVEVYERMLVSIIDYSIGETWAKNYGLVPLLACWMLAAGNEINHKRALPENSRLTVLLCPQYADLVSQARQVYQQIHQEQV